MNTTGGRIYGPKVRFGLGCAGAVVFMAPLVCAMILAVVVPSYAGIICVSGMALAFGLGFWAMFAIRFRYGRRFRARLAAKYPDELRDLLLSEPLVGFSPGDKVKHYNGDTSWDLGVLILEPGRMRYFGDICTFDLRPDQVVSADTKRPVNTLGIAYHRTRVFWRMWPESEPQSFTLEPWDAHGIFETKKVAAALKDRIEAWRQAAAPAEPARNELGFPPLPGQANGVDQLIITEVGTVATLAALVASALLAGAVTVFILWLLRLFGFRPSRWAIIPAVYILLTAVAPLARRFQAWIDARAQHS